MSYSFIQNLLYNCKFHSVKDEQLDTITSLILLILTMLPSLCLIISEQTLSSSQCICCSTGVKVIVPKTKLQNVGVDPGVGTLGGPDPLKICKRDQSMFCPPPR